MTSIGSSFRVLAQQKTIDLRAQVPLFRLLVYLRHEAARGALEKQRKEKQLVGQRCVKRQRGWKIGDRIKQQLQTKKQVLWLAKRVALLRRMVKT